MASALPVESTLEIRRSPTLASNRVSTNCEQGEIGIQNLAKKSLWGRTAFAAATLTVLFFSWVQRRFGLMKPDATNAWLLALVKNFHRKDRSEPKSSQLTAIPPAFGLAGSRLVTDGLTGPAPCRWSVFRARQHLNKQRSDRPYRGSTEDEYLGPHDYAANPKNDPSRQESLPLRAQHQDLHSGR